MAVNIMQEAAGDFDLDMAPTAATFITARNKPGASRQGGGNPSRPILAAGVEALGLALQAHHHEAEISKWQQCIKVFLDLHKARPEDHASLEKNLPKRQR
jgi:hypothetical protein